MKFLVLGKDYLSISIAKGIIDSGHELNLIVSMSPQLSPDNSIDMDSFCLKNDVPYLETDDINSDYLIKELKNKKPDYIFSTWPKIIKNSLKTYL